MFSIIVPTCNRPDLLVNCLGILDLLRNDSSLSSFEVIVTDDSMNDITEQFCKISFPWVRYIKGPFRGPAANRNNGASIAKGDWLIFLDDDCIPEKELLKAYAEAITVNKEQFVFEGAILPLGGQTAFNQECPINTRGGNLWSCNFCIFNTHFKLLNGFDEQFPFPAMEDMDLHIRASAIHPIKFLPSARVWHPWKIISNPEGRFNQAFISHKLLLEKWPQQRSYFGYDMQTKKLLRHFFITAPANMFKFRFRGLSYLWYYYKFLVKTAFFSLKN